MRHRKAGRKFGRQSGPRNALISGLVTNLVRDERIRTTDAKAKEIRRYVERTISWGASVAELVEREPDKLEEHERARIIHAMRMARRTVRNRDVLHKLFHEVAPRYQGRNGGYTRIIKIGWRPGDAAPMSYIELIPSEGGAAEEEAPEADEKETKKKAKKPAAEAKAAAPKGKKAAAKSEKAPAKKAKKSKKDED
jgi:large subunit ribosomal protein L17